MSERVSRYGAAGLALVLWAGLTLFAPGPARFFFPAILLAVSVMVVLAGPGPGLALAGGVIALDVGAVSAGRLPVAEAMAHAAFLTLFAGAFGAVLRAEILRLRQRHRADLVGARDRWLRDARDYRLFGSVISRASQSPRSVPERDELRRIGSVEAFRAWTSALLELCRSAVGADAVRLFTVTPEGRLREVESSARGAPRAAREPSGALGAVLKTGRPVHLLPRADGARLGYAPDGPVAAFMALAVKDGPVVTGILAAERKAVERFDDRAEATLAEAAVAMVHALEAERIFAEMDRTQNEQAHFLDTVRLVAEALGPEPVAERLVEATTRLVDGDLIAVSLWDAGAKAHRIVAVHAEAGLRRRLDRHEMPDDGQNLVSQALLNLHALPYVPLSKQSVRRDDRILGGIDVSLEAVKVFPITHRNDRLGALIVGSTRDPRGLDRDVERTLESVCAQAAVSLANARMYERMERMATLDGLTGLVNHRRFQEHLRDALARAERLSHEVSVVFVDADHFKTVNDTFGHPVGDEVLRRIAMALQDVARRTDVVARYGGEEFVMLLEGTDARGAAELAERARRRIEGLAIDGEFGRLRVTVSLGVCTFPEPAPDREALLARADKALYEAKQRGRNRVRVYGGAVCAEPERSDKDHDGSGRADPRVPV